MAEVDLGEQLQIIYPEEQQKEIEAAEFVADYFSHEHRRSRRIATALLLSGLGAAAALGLDIDGIRPSNLDLANFTESAETIATFGLGLIGTCTALRAKRMRLSRERTILSLDRFRAQASELFSD